MNKSVWVNGVIVNRERNRFHIFGFFFWNSLISRGSLSRDARINGENNERIDSFVISYSFFDVSKFQAGIEISKYDVLTRSERA